ncbi:MAG: hypothetical protein WBL88_05980 [Nitrososphaeraceae archaeon]
MSKIWIYRFVNRRKLKCSFISTPWRRLRRPTIIKRQKNMFVLATKIENTLRNTHDDILFLISTEEVFLNIKNQIYKFIKIFSELNVDARILFPRSDGLRDLAFEFEKYSKVRFQRLYRPLSKDYSLESRPSVQQPINS